MSETPSVNENSTAQIGRDVVHHAETVMDVLELTIPSEISKLDTQGLITLTDNMERYEKEYQQNNTTA